jgi:hypothetical protein
MNAPGAGLIPIAFLIFLSHSESLQHSIEKNAEVW